MINGKEFTERLKKILDFHSLSASTFADKIGVQRSSISHILSGRNKPSLDFILKITTEFTSVDINWLLNGEGIFPKNEKAATSNHTSTPTFLNTENASAKKIQRIVVFFEDGTFKEYHT